MPIVYNIPRHRAKSVGLDFPNHIWISIQEPTSREGKPEEHISNEFLDKLPKLKMKFWDLVEKVPVIGGDGFLEPPNEDDAKQIVDFLIKHKGKSVISNCRMGVSRSAAISLFCVDFLGYEWDRESEARAVPNMKLYRLMTDYYHAKY